MTDFQAGNLITCLQSSEKGFFHKGNNYGCMKHADGKTVFLDDTGQLRYINNDAYLGKFQLVTESNKDQKPMIKSITSDMKSFIVEHKSTLYVIAVLVLADHFLFQGAFRERLHGLMNKALGKVENILDKKHE